MPASASSRTSARRLTAPANGRGASPPPRILILDPRPAIEGGRFRPKRTEGETVRVSATILADGHDVLRAVVRWKPPGARRWSEAPLAHVDKHVDGDTWEGEFPVDRLGRWCWTIEAWVDHFASWRDELARKVAFGQDDLSGELSEGVVLLREAAERAKGADRKLIEQALAAVDDESASQEARHQAALDPQLAVAAERHPDRGQCGSLDAPLEVEVDRERARFGSWYELFPRSWGGFEGVRAIVPELAQLGFDVLYLTPVHPIGETNRKGRNNALTAGPRDPGSPWAIGLKGVGGHEAIHPDLGTVADFEALVATCGEHGMDVALDFAIQCSADHPWLTEHPEWFHHRPDGSLKYAENPPKKYQDIYNVNFQCEDWRALWQALLDVVLLWVERGVTVFRVDNPHTKPLRFWEWLIGEVRAKHPEVVFLAEAFTRRALMRALAKIGFNQSYTYFTWKQSRWELTEYLSELAGETADYFRPNFFVNTPDILTEQLQHGGRPVFEARLVLGATLSPTYGIYSGYEWLESTAVRPGSEEYLDSEKYEIRERTLDGAPLLPMVRLLNEARRAHPALQHLAGVEFLDTANEALLAYARRHAGDVVICVVCLDPHQQQEGLVTVPAHLGVPPAFQVQDLLTGHRHDWRLGGNYVRLGPGTAQAHVLRVAA